jgi:hypothetical protein
VVGLIHIHHHHLVCSLVSTTRPRRSHPTPSLCQHVDSELMAFLDLGTSSTQDKDKPEICEECEFLWGYPHKLVHGYLVAGWAMNDTGVDIYIRGEFYLVALYTQHAIDEAYEAGFLGENAYESGYKWMYISIKVRGRISVGRGQR